MRKLNKINILFSAMKNILPFVLFLIPLFSSAQCPNTEIYLETQADVDNFATNYPNCTTLVNNLWIGTQPNNITNIGGLSSITSAQNIYMRHAQISDFFGLRNLEDALDLSIGYNNSMASLQGFNSLQSLVRLHVFSSSSIVSLSGIDNLQVADNITLFMNSSLTDISQLSFLVNVNLLDISNNALSSLSGLENLQTVGNDLEISNELIENFNDLSSIETIGGSLRIRNNVQLYDLTAFSGLELLEDLILIGSPLLSNLSGLENLQNISGRLRIGFNPGLIDLSVFSNLNSVRDFDIYDNENLASLSGLENLQLISNRLLINRNTSLVSIDALNDLSTAQINEVGIVNNSNLAVCNNQFICSTIADSSVLKSLYNNDVGCNTLLEVETSCLLASTDIKLNKSVAVYPNPVSEFLRVAISNEFILEGVTVFSILGQELINCKKENLNFSHLPRGIYFVEVATNKGSITRRVIKQ
jgi:hypothetical protein